MDKLFAVEPDIAPLVLTLNTHGFTTFASCQGHGFPCDRLAPYVAFRAPTGLVRQFERWLRKDMEAQAPQLRWGWYVQAGFDSEFRLAWRLQPAGPHQWYSRYQRHSVRHDLTVLNDKVMSIFKKIQRIKNAEVDQNGNNDDCSDQCH